MGKIQAWVSSELHWEKITSKLKLINLSEKIVIFGFCKKISVYGEFFIKKFSIPPNEKDLTSSTVLTQFNGNSIRKLNSSTCCDVRV